MASRSWTVVCGVTLGWCLHSNSCTMMSSGREAVERPGAVRLTVTAVESAGNHVLHVMQGTDTRTSETFTVAGELRGNLRFRGCWQARPFDASGSSEL
jgi:hypothetical protein